MLHYLDKKYFLVCFLLLLFKLASSQIELYQDRKMWLDADINFEFGDYLSAMKSYEKLIKLDSNNQEIKYHLGVCYFELKRNLDESVKLLTKCSPKKFIEVSYYIGRLNHSLRKFDEAIVNYNTYKKIKGEKLRKPKEIDDLIAKCYTAKLFENNAQKNIQIENLGETVNSIYADYAPLITAEENELFFTSRRENSFWSRKDPFGDFYENIFYSKKTDNKWQTPIMLDTNINTDFHDAGTGIAMDGSKLLLYRTSVNLTSGNIYETIFSNNQWTAPVLLNANINSINYTETNACYSPDRKTIFFSSDRPGGFGGKDLYFVKQLPNGEWGEPFNLGSHINTEYNESAPFIHPSGELLFFSSEGHQNMGGYDIFKSSFDESGIFSSPINLGYPINTVDDDVFFVLNADGSRGYFSSAREGGFGSHDIYNVVFSENKLPLNVFKINVFDDSNVLLKKVDIEMIDLSSKKLFGKYKSNEINGKVIVISEPNKEYEINIKAEGYESFVTHSILNNNESNIVFSLKKKKDE